MSPTRTLILIAFLASLAGCCPHEIASPQALDIEPLFSSSLPEDRYTLLPLFPNPSEIIVAEGHHKDGHPNPEGMTEWIEIRRPDDAYNFHGLTADVQLFGRAQDAQRSFDFEWRTRWWRPDHSKFIIRGSDANRCVVSYFSRPRVGSDVPFSCAHESSYYSFVTFLKGRVVITITQTSDSTDLGPKEQMIRRLTDTLARGAPFATSASTTGRSP